ncbi:MAG: hypothetical protein ABI968_10585 [Acidobacteriota bacterium]
MEVAPSPKFHNQAVGAGVPVDRSVKITGWPMAGLEGVKVKLVEGASPARTTTLFVAEPDPTEFVAVSLTA